MKRQNRTSPWYERLIAEGVEQSVQTLEEAIRDGAHSAYIYDQQVFLFANDGTTSLSELAQQLGGGITKSTLSKKSALFETFALEGQINEAAYGLMYTSRKWTVCERVMRYLKQHPLEDIAEWFYRALNEPPARLRMLMGQSANSPELITVPKSVKLQIAKLREKLSSLTGQDISFAELQEKVFSWIDEWPDEEKLAWWAALHGEPVKPFDAMVSDLVGVIVSNKRLIRRDQFIDFVNALLSDRDHHERKLIMQTLDECGYSYDEDALELAIAKAKFVEPQLRVVQEVA